MLNMDIVSRNKSQDKWQVELEVPTRFQTSHMFRCMVVFTSYFTFRESSSESGSTVILDTPRPLPVRDPIMLDIDIPGSVAARTQRSPLQVCDDDPPLYCLTFGDEDLWVSWLEMTRR